MNISRVTLDEMLLGRERRALKQAELGQNGRTVVCLTMNIAGDVKKSPLIDIAFNEGVKRIEAALPGARCMEVFSFHTGPEAFFVYEADGAEIKRTTVAIEEREDWARLLDIDVIGSGGEKLSRGMERRCIVCGGPVTACARSRAHGLDKVRAAADALLCGLAAKKLAETAADALTAEVEATPKPGLVDMNNSGAHRDMDLDSFMRSIAAIGPHFENMALAALSGPSLAPASLMAGLREEGRRAEEDMLRATGGVNTHKGAIFSLGLAVAGAALSLRTGCGALEHAAALARSAVEGELENSAASPRTHGEAVYAATGLTGARGEAAAGFPKAVRAKGRYESFRAMGYARGEALALTLPSVMAETDDTNIVHRGGREGLAVVKLNASLIESLPVGRRLEALKELDAEFIRLNLSPGGSADILSLAVFLSALDGIIPEI